MKKILIMKKVVLFMFIAAVILSSTSCDKENTDYRPELPPVESLIMDFDDFDQSPITDKVIAYTYDNFQYAFTSLVFWNSITSLTMAVPVGAYINVANMSGTPEYLGDNRWRWTKEFTVQMVNYKAILTAERLNNAEFSVEMKIALAALPAAGVVWFDGVVRYDHTHAEWNLYKNEPTHVKVLEVEWNKDYETGSSDLTYTYVEPGQNETNSTIEMGIVPGADYDAYYSVTLSAGTLDIEWDRTSKAGRVNSLQYFDNSDWHCWNDQLQDITCPVK